LCPNSKNGLNNNWLIVALQHSSFSPAQLLQSLSSVDQQNFDKLKAAYDACMDEDTIKKAGIKPLIEVIHQIADIFPVVESAFQRRTPLLGRDKDDIPDVLFFLNKLGLSPLISLGAGADDKDPDVVVIQASPPWRIGLPAKNYYEDPSVLKDYKETVAQVIENVDPDHKRENATLHAEWMRSNGHGKIAARGTSKNSADEVVEFERQLAAASPDPEDSQDVTVSNSLYVSKQCIDISGQKYYNPMSLKNADLLTPQIQLAKIIDKLAPSDYTTERLIVGSPSYMKNLTEILSNTSRETLQTYFIWKVIQAFASEIEADEIKPYTRFVNKLQGKVCLPIMTVDKWAADDFRILTPPQNDGELVSAMLMMVSAGF
jgi:endothelin-converting enzyme